MNDPAATIVSYIFAAVIIGCAIYFIHNWRK
jgi:hypothetical protein